MIKIGSAGFNEEIAPFLKKHKMKCAEIEFVRQIYIKKKEKIDSIKNAAQNNNISLSVHAPYYVNLASSERYKILASKKRILQSAQIGELIGAKYVCFHPGFYMKRNPEKVYEIIAQEIGDMQDQLNENNAKIKLAPELMGKHSQFGTAEELHRLNKDIKGISVTIDFAHYFARNLGNPNYQKLINKLPKTFHSHFSGIEYTNKGEKRHIKIDPKEFEKVIKEIMLQEKDCTMINESSDVINDLLIMRNILNKYQKN
jgi:deoxyribonuclease-4